MTLRELIKKDIEELGTDELVLISEQIRLIKKLKPLPGKTISLEEIRKLTAASKSNWADDVLKERLEQH